MTKRNWLYGLILIVGASLLLLAIWQVGIKSIVLTRQHGNEMYNVLLNYEKTVHSIESHQNPDILLDIAQGDALAYLQKYRCPECPTVPIVINVNIEDLKVLEYSDTYAKVFSRIETAAVSVNPRTREIKSKCRATAIEGVDTMIREDGNWKIMGGDGRADTWTPVEELREKICPENYDLNP